MSWLVLFPMLVTVFLNRCLTAQGQQFNRQPHIIYILADDLGFNDVPWTNPEIKAEHLNYIAEEGIILANNYNLHVCTPSRTSLMTGLYPFRTGRQYRRIRPLEPTGVPLRFPFLSEELKRLGYHTHIVGKWHLGYCAEEYLPQNRGFDSFFGMLLGSMHYTEHTSSHGFKEARKDELKSLRLKSRGWALWNGSEPFYPEPENIHSTELYAKEAVRIIDGHPANETLFLYLALQQPHSPVVVEENYLAKYRRSKLDRKRMEYLGLVETIERTLKKVLACLERRDMYDNSIIIFNSDNGGSIQWGGSNFPLRGGKGSLYDGGTRFPAVVFSPMLQKLGIRAQVKKGLFHMSDWFKTIIRVAGGTPPSGLDGYDMWDYITKEIPSPRDEVVINISDALKFSGSIRYQQWKLIVHCLKEKYVDGDIPDPCYECMEESSIPDSCPEVDGRPSFSVELYNMDEDVSEENNLAFKNIDFVKQMLQRLEKYWQESQSVDILLDDPKGLPTDAKDPYAPGWCTAQQ